MSEYDTAAIRREANKLKKCCDRLNTAAIDRMRNAQRYVERDLRGKAADALEESLAQSLRQIKSLRDDLEATYLGLYRFADALEEADARAARLMKR